MTGTPPNTTMLLDTQAWDLVLDAAGNWAAASPPYAVAQDAASEIRTFLGEVYYDTARGLPYLGDILGQAPSIPFLKSQMTAAALLVPGVTAAKTFLTGVSGRIATGQVQTTDVNGKVATVNF